MAWPLRGWTLQTDGLGSIQAGRFVSGVTLSKFLNLHVPLFPRLWNGRMKQVNARNSLRWVPVRTNVRYKY